jgi:membrane-associated phospholipid phosphatase
MSIRLVRGISLFVALSVAPVPAAAQQSGQPESTPRRIQKVIVDDLKSVANVDTFPIVLAAAAFAMTAWPYDAEVTQHAASSPLLKDSFDGWARIGGQEWLLGGTALATYAFGRAFDHRGMTAVGADLMEAQAIAGTTTLAVKLAVHRSRPDGYPRSFPSGHASGTFAAATVLQRHFGWKIGIPAYTAATLVTTARLQANSHYPTDLIIGTMVGILAGRAATFDLGSHRVRLLPAIGAGGAFAVTGTFR